ncbi:c-type cytochrome biogenesis protein CcmI [Pararhodobacter oceanensis]|uniref:c-type cytochrome biogenesis protein CcmI n=1 Tax=Pararhodobacter oceanensis TaxID=2172121 RepID=UPI003A9106BD
MAELAFWLPAAALSLIAVALVVLGLKRGAQAAAGTATDKREMRIYADQLREIERDRARGVVSEDEAERMRAETARRLLEADKQAQAEVKRSPAAARGVAIALALLMPVAALAFYWTHGAPLYRDQPIQQRFAEAAEMREARPAQADLQAAWQTSPERPVLPEIDPEYAALMEQLREAVADRPEDLQGNRLLASNEANVGNYAAAAEAWLRVIELQGARPEIADMLGLAEAMVQAAGGVVSPEAEVVLEQILQRDPRNGAARYYLGLSLGQTGRPDLTFRLWRGLLEDSAPDAPWVPVLRAELEGLAAVAGVRYTLPPLAAQGARGPSEGDIAAASDLSAAERQEMIGGMVEGLAQRLAAMGGPPEDWARLIDSLGVLGQTDRARAIWAEARMVFADQPQALIPIDEAAARLGFTE